MSKFSVQFIVKNTLGVSSVTRSGQLNRIIPGISHDDKYNLLAFTRLTTDVPNLNSKKVCLTRSRTHC